MSSFFTPTKPGMSFNKEKDLRNFTPLFRLSTFRLFYAYASNHLHDLPALFFDIFPSLDSKRNTFWVYFIQAL
jgi:hypothetical protein